MSIQERGFNSKLVRLKGKTQNLLTLTQQSFNSKLVRLKEDSPHRKLKKLRFNSKLVRLKAQKRILPKHILNVSIPNWFD